MVWFKWAVGRRGLHPTGLPLLTASHPWAALRPGEASATATGAEGTIQPVTQGFVQLMDPETKIQNKVVFFLINRERPRKLTKKHYPARKLF